MTAQRRPGVLDVRSFIVDASILEFGDQFLRDTGSQGFEGLVLWGGRRRGAAPIVDIELAVAPKQRCFRTERGVGLSVDEDELFRINADFYSRGLRLVGQVHSHPAEAYHSDVDDDYATVTIPGGISLVVPDFARRPFSLDTAAVHRLDAAGTWRALDDAATRDLIHIAGSINAGDR